jgi:phytoene dehydrogenase-like protein
MLKYPNVGQLLGPYSNILDKVLPKNGKKGNRFIRNWLDMLSFLLSGLPADGTITAEVAFMFAEWYRPGVKLDYPVGGSEGIVDALIRGIEKNGGKVVLKQHVQNIIVEGGEAAGVVLKGGQKIKARKAVVSNAALRNTARLLGPDDVPPSWRSEVEETPECPSFMHLHCGFSADGLKEAMGGKELQCHYMVVNGKPRHSKRQAIDPRGCCATTWP